MQIEDRAGFLIHIPRSRVAGGAPETCFEVAHALLDWFGGPSTVVAAAIFFAVAAAVWHSMAGSVMGRVGSVALALMLVALLTFAASLGVLGYGLSAGAIFSVFLALHLMVLAIPAAFLIRRVRSNGD